MAQPGTVLKAKSLQASLPRSPSRGTPACSMLPAAKANVPASHSTTNTPQRILPPANQSPTPRKRSPTSPPRLRRALFLCSDFASPPNPRPRPLRRRSLMRRTDRLSHLPDIIGRLAFGLDRVDVNVGLKPQRQFQLRFVQVHNLRFQQRVDRPVWIPCILR